MDIRRLLVLLMVVVAPLVLSGPALASPCLDPTPALSFSIGGGQFLIDSPVSVEINEYFHGSSLFDDSKGVDYSISGDSQTYHSTSEGGVGFTPTEPNFTLTVTWYENNYTAGVIDCTRIQTFNLTATDGTERCPPGTVSAYDPAWPSEIARGRSAVIKLPLAGPAGVRGPVSADINGGTTIVPSSNGATIQIDGIGRRSYIPVSLTFKQGSQDGAGNITIGLCTMTISDHVPLIAGRTPSRLRVVPDSGDSTIELLFGSSAKDCAAAAHSPLIFTYGTRTLKTADWCEGTKTGNGDDWEANLDRSGVWFHVRTSHTNSTRRTPFSVRIGNRMIRRGSILVDHYDFPTTRIFEGTDAFVNYCINHLRPSTPRAAISSAMRSASTVPPFRC